jgi:hypothetical protein
MNQLTQNQSLHFYLVNQRNMQLHVMSNKLTNNSSGKHRDAWQAVTADFWRYFSMQKYLLSL